MMTRYFQWISLVTAGLLLMGCATQNRMAEGKHAPLLASGETVAQYNLSIELKKHHFSGLLITKETNEEDIRIRGISHFGLSLFDFGLEQGVWKVYGIADLLNHERMLQLLEHDFRLLFLPDSRMRQQRDTPDYTAFTAGKGWLKSRIRQYKPGSARQGKTEINHPWLGVRVTVDYR